MSIEKFKDVLTEVGYDVLAPGTLSEVTAEAVIQQRDFAQLAADPQRYLEHHIDSLRVSLGLEDTDGVPVEVVEDAHTGALHIRAGEVMSADASTQKGSNAIPGNTVPSRPSRITSKRG